MLSETTGVVKTRPMAWKTKKLASRTFIHDRHVFKEEGFGLPLRDKNEDAHAIAFQMICKSVVSRLNVVFLI